MTADINKLPRMLAKVPYKLIAPSVPGGTGFKFVIKYVFLPHLLPTSLPKVSANFAEKLAAKPIKITQKNIKNTDMKSQT